MLLCGPACNLHTSTSFPVKTGQVMSSEAHRYVSSGATATALNSKVLCSQKLMQSRNVVKSSSVNIPAKKVGDFVSNHTNPKDGTEHVGLPCCACQSVIAIGLTSSPWHLLPWAELYKCSQTTLQHNCVPINSVLSWQGDDGMVGHLFSKALAAYRA